MSDEFKQGHPMRRRLDEAALDEMVRDMREKLSTEPSMLRVALAGCTAIELLGSIHGAKVGPSVSEAMPLFTTSGNILGQSRIERFGETLYNLQSIDGFDDWVKDYAPAEPEARFAEIDAARMMYRAGVLHRLRGRVGTRREDYDCDLLVDGSEVACDIKAKLETTEISVMTLVRSVRKAHDQLPTGIPSIVWIRLPYSWAQLPAPMQLTLEVALLEIRTWAEHVIGIVCHWEELNAPLAMSIKYRLLPCTRSANHLKLLARLDERLGTRSAHPWLSFADFVDRYC